MYNTLHTIADGNIAADSDALTLESVSVYAGEYIELSASNNVLPYGFATARDYDRSG